MPSSYTASLRFEKQFTGENVNTWGIKLNTALDRIDSTIAGFVTVALTGNYSITSSNTADDEARSAMLKFTGGSGPFAVTIPAVSKIYLIWNATTGPVTITTGSGVSETIDTTDIVLVFCDGVNVKTTGYGGASAKAYISSVAAGGTGTVPSVIGNSGKWLTNNGSIAMWVTLQVADLADYVADQAAKTTAATGRAIAFATVL